MKNVIWQTENEKGRDLLTSLALNFYRFGRIIRLPTISLAASLPSVSCAGDFELGALVLFALFKRGLGLCGALLIEWCKLAVGQRRQVRDRLHLPED